MAKINRIPKIRQVVDFSEDEFRHLLELGEALGLKNTEVLRRALALLYQQEIAHHD